MKILFCTNLPSPYRADFFNELGKLCDLTVCFERKASTERDVKWVGSRAIHYHEVYLDLKPKGTDKSAGPALRRFVKNNHFDRVIFTNYVSESCVEAIMYCKLKKIPYWIEYDGGFHQKDQYIKRIIKKLLLSKAEGHLTTSGEHIKYLEELGIGSNRIHKYPFTSVFEKEIIQKPLSQEDKIKKRKQLGIKGDRIVISVGRFNYQDGEGKGFDLLFHVAEELKDTDFYIVGDEPTERFTKWKLEKKLDNVHFVSFMIKKDLFEYYYASDLMVLLTRKDMWGLVVNESMACGLPVLTTDQCVAGLEMVHEGENGYIVPANTYEFAVKDIQAFFADPAIKEKMSTKCIETAKEYTIEKMVQRHLDIL